MSRVAYEREPVPMAKRARLSSRLRLKVWSDHGGLCGLCGLPVGFTACEMDHQLSLVAGGSNDLANWQPLHPACHKAKTRADKGIGAKIKRLIARAAGTRRERKAIASRGFDKSLKRGFDGKVVRR